MNTSIPNPNGMQYQYISVVSPLSLIKGMECHVGIFITAVLREEPRIPKTILLLDGNTFVAGGS